MASIDKAWLDVVRVFEEGPQQCITEYPNVESELLREEAFRYLTRLFSVGPAMTIENADPAYPELFPLWGLPWMNCGLPCPDSQYFYAPIHGDFEYRISGERGTSHMLRVLVYDGGIFDFSSSKVLSHMEHCRRPDHSFDGALAVDAGGRVEIVLSREPREGNWLELPPGHGMLIIRQELYDWDSEQLAPIWIERLGASYPPPPAAVGQIEEGAKRLTSYLRDHLVHVGKASTVIAQRDPSRIEFVPEFADEKFRVEQGQPGQLYGPGNFKCGRDEAVILEVEKPDCNYWSFALYSPFLEIMDHHRRQASLNGHQARVDADGVFRAVISQQDPGVANWLDCGNHDEGLIVGRYVGAVTRPVARLKVVPFDQVNQHLPSGTPVISPSERSAALRRRWFSYYRSRGFGAALPSGWASAAAAVSHIGAGLNVE